MRALLLAALLGLCAMASGAQELGDYEKKVIEFTLPNGMHFIVLERHQVPVISFHTYVNVGSAQDPAGLTGMSHLMERLAFTGSETIGTRNWTAEKKALEDLDTLNDQLQQERDKGARSNAGRTAAVQAEIQLAAAAAREQEISGEFLRAIQENGAVNVNCHATPDSIETSYSLPSNRIELWFLLEAQRLAHPAFRDFYRERDGAMSDIAGSVDARPSFRLEQSLLASAFEAEPYRNPVLGWPSDVFNIRRADVRAFFDTYFVPGNMVIAIVGDVEPGNARLLAEKYFAPLPAKPLPPAMHTQEPPQFGPKTIALWGAVQPQLMIAYKRPGESHRDDIALAAVRMILGEGRTS